MRRLSKSEIPVVRLAKWQKQDKICLLCLRPIEKENTVLDHDHDTGECRGVLHRGCNALLGKLENGRAINNLTDHTAWVQWLSNVAKYIEEAKMGVYHPSHKTEEEKRLLRNKKAVKRRRVNKAKGTSLKGRVSYGAKNNDIEESQED